MVRSNRDGRFSRPTQAALIEVVAELYTQDQLDQLFRRLEAETEDDWDGPRPTKLRRVRAAVDVLLLRGPIQGSDVLELCRILLEERLEGGVLRIAYRQSTLPRLLNGLKADGYELVDGRLVQTSPDAAPIGDDMTALGADLEARGWTVALTHYRQAVANFTDAEFESSNGQLRSFLEELLTRVASDRVGQPSGDPKGNIDKLSNSGVMTRDEAQFFKGLINLSNTKGSHPGTSTSDEALFRLHTTVASARWILALHRP